MYTQGTDYPLQMGRILLRVSLELFFFYFYANLKHEIFGKGHGFNFEYRVGAV
jgi:hypothetical protein